MEMKKDDKAYALAEKIERETEGLPVHALATRLRKMLQPPPPMKEILARIVAKDESERARLVGVSRQGYYNWVNEVSRPSVMAAHRLAELTGVSVETIRNR
jgi:DNA-binding XRE family transcriptional regulator